METNPRLKAITGSFRFLEAGVVKYEDEMVYIASENLMKIAEAHKGRPMIIEHQGVNADNADEVIVGYVLNVRKNEEDGWAWADYVCYDETASNLIKQGGNVSCAYSVNKAGPSGVWHNVPYDREILEATGDHVAIVQNPRYEKAKIIINSNTELMSEEKTVLEAIKNTLVEGFETLKNAMKKNEDEPKKEEEKEEKKNKKKKFNDSDTITIGDDEVSIKELADCYRASKKKNAEDEKSEDKKEEKQNEDDSKKEEKPAEVKNNHLLNAKEAHENGSAQKESKAKFHTIGEAYALGKKLC